MLHAGHLKVSSLFQQDLPARRGVANAHGRILPDGEEIIRFGEQSRSHAEFSHSRWSLQGCGISTVDLPVNAVKDLSQRISGRSRSPFSPWEGEKVADRPDEGVFA